MNEFDCEGCGAHVTNFVTDAPPSHGFCTVCLWLQKYVPDPEEMEKLRRACWETNGFEPDRRLAQEAWARAVAMRSESCG